MKQYKFNINGNGYNVTINSVAGTHADVTVNGISYKVELENVQVSQPQPCAPQTVTVAAPAPVQVVSMQPQATPVEVRSEQAPVSAPSSAPAAPVSSGEGEAVTAPLPGVIIELKVNIGDQVSAGQEIAVLEAMKMENSIEAPKAGTITGIHAAKGDSVLEGTVIVTIQ